MANANNCTCKEKENQIKLDHSNTIPHEVARFFSFLNKGKGLKEVYCI